MFYYSMNVCDFKQRNKLICNNYNNRGTVDDTIMDKVEYSRLSFKSL